MQDKWEMISMTILAVTLNLRNHTWALD